MRAHEQNMEHLNKALDRVTKLEDTVTDLQDTAVKLEEKVTQLQNDNYTLTEALKNKVDKKVLGKGEPVIFRIKKKNKKK